MGSEGLDQLLQLAALKEQAALAKLQVEQQKQIAIKAEIAELTAQKSPTGSNNVADARQFSHWCRWRDQKCAQLHADLAAGQPKLDAVMQTARQAVGRLAALKDLAERARLENLRNAQRVE